MPPEVINTLIACSVVGGIGWCVRMDRMTAKLGHALGENGVVTLQLRRHSDAIKQLSSDCMSQQNVLDVLGVLVDDPEVLSEMAVYARSIESLARRRIEKKKKD